MIRDYSQLDEWAALVIDGEELVSAGRLNSFDSGTPNQLSDEALLNAIAGGAVWAMESLYQRYSRSLYSLVYRMVANQQVAEDLLQDAFLAVWRRATTYSPQRSTVRNWLFSITENAPRKPPSFKRGMNGPSFRAGWDVGNRSDHSKPGRRQSRVSPVPKQECYQLHSSHVTAPVVSHLGRY